MKKSTNRRRLNEIRKAANPDTVENFAAAVRLRAEQTGSDYFTVKIEPITDRAESKYFSATTWRVWDSTTKERFSVYIGAYGVHSGKTAAEALAKLDAAIAAKQAGAIPAEIALRGF